MMKFLKLLKEDKNLLFAVSVFVLTAAATVVGFVLLPQKMFVELFSQRSVPETSKTIFLSIGLIVVALSGIMCFFAENVKKWLATEVVLSLAFVGCIVYNLIVL
jgi:hypothetical protein